MAPEPWPTPAAGLRIAFGASNLASGLAQGFPVTGADSRTAVNNAVGGKSQMVSIVAAVAMLFALLFLKAPLALVPTAALAGVVFAVRRHRARALSRG